MDFQKIKSLWFSPNGTTQRIVERIAGNWSVPVESLDLLRTPLKMPQKVLPDTLLVIGLPVYAGRIPSLCREMLLRISSNGAPAVAAVVYGNRDYEDALIELTDLLAAQGFWVIGAGAWVARHCIFPNVAADRPNAEDFAEVDAFSAQCRDRLMKSGSGMHPIIEVKGNRPYRKAGAVPLKPSGDERCTECGACAALCPVGAIDAKIPRQTDGMRCISCGACINNCPAHARGYHGIAYQLARKTFEAKCSVPHKPETFFAGE